MNKIVLLLGLFLAGCSAQSELEWNAESASYNQDCADIVSRDFDFSSEIPEANEGCAEWVGIPDEHMITAIKTTDDRKAYAGEKEISSYDAVLWYYVMRAHFNNHRMDNFARYKLTADMLESPMAVSYGVIQNDAGEFFIPQVIPDHDPSKAVVEGIKAYSIKVYKPKGN